MNKLSKVDRAKLVHAWTKALNAEKVSSWAKENLVNFLQPFIEGTQNDLYEGINPEGRQKLYVGKLDCEEGTEVILMTVNKIGVDYVDVLVYDPYEGTTDIINPFTQLRGIRELPWIEIITAQEVGDTVEIHHSDIDEDRTYKVLNKMSQAYVGGFLIENSDNHELNLLTLAKLKSTMKA